MLYKFKCKATGDLVMLAPHGDTLLRVWGREPAPRGIVEPQDMDEALRRIDQAIADEDAERAAAEREAAAAGAQLPPRGVGLRQRLWPMAQMLRRARQAGEPVVWGV